MPVVHHLADGSRTSLQESDAGGDLRVTKANNDGFEPTAVRPEEIPNFELVYELAWQMAWSAWPNRPGRGGNRQGDTVGPKGRAIQPVLVATTGLRNGEMFALRPSHVDLDNLEIDIRDQLVQENGGERHITTPKHGSIRTVTFAGFLKDDMEEFIEHRRRGSGENDPILFCAPRGGLEWRSNHNERFRSAARRASWPDHLKWYGLRHLFAVTMLEHVPLEIVSRLMGHHSPDFTAKRYLSLRVGWLDKARDASRDLDPFA